MSDGAVLLLGCGAVGLAAARLLGRDRAVRRVIAADRLAGRAAAARELCAGKGNSVRLDAADDISLAKVLSDVSLLINTAPLPLGALLSLIRSAVESGVSYVDSGSDADAIQAVFDSQYLETVAARQAVSVAPGLGTSPGLANALASYLGQRLERVDEARFYMLDDLRRRGFDEWRERLTTLGSPALVWRGGDWRHVSPMAEREDALFPAPWGCAPCFTVGIGPVTLPASIVSLTQVSSHWGFVDPAMAEIMGNLVSYGFADERAIDTPSGAASPLEFAASFFSGSRETWTVPRSASPFGFASAPGPTVRQAVVDGILQGKATRFRMTYHFPGESDAENAAATLAVGARMLLTRELPAPGVHAPESLDPAPFLWDMERRGVEIQLTKTVKSQDRRSVASCIG